MLVHACLPVPMQGIFGSDVALDALRHASQEGVVYYLGRTLLRTRQG